jgi:hypothetical protein
MSPLAQKTKPRFGRGLGSVDENPGGWGALRVLATSHLSLKMIPLHHPHKSRIVAGHSGEVFISAPSACVLF